MVRPRTITRWLAIAMLAGALLPTAAWAAAPSLTKPFEAVSFADASHGYIAGLTGTSGVLSWTNDGGATWHPTETPNKAFSAVTATAGGEVTALDDLFNGIHKSDNFGATWTTENLPLDDQFPSVDLKGMAYLAGGRRVVVGQLISSEEGVIASSVGGGVWNVDKHGPEYWAQDGQPLPSKAKLSAVDAAPDGNTAWAVGYDWAEDRQVAGPYRALIYKWANSGSTWTTQTVSGTTPVLNCVTAASDQAAFIGQESRFLLRTRDGVNWASIEITDTTIASITGIDALDADHVLAVGYSTNGQGRLAWTANASALTPTWAVNATSSVEPLLDAQMIDATHWIAVGDNETILRTNDAGATWTGGQPVPVVPPVVPPVVTPVAPAATAIALSTISDSSIPYGSTFKISGILLSGSTGVLGQPVILQSATPTGDYADTSYQVPTITGGAFSFSVKPSTKTRYRVRFAGTASFAAAGPTAGIYVTPKTYVRTPIAASTMKHTKSYTVYGYLKPKHKAGSYPVRIYKWRKTASGKYKAYGYVKAKASTYHGYTKYSVKLKLKTKGKWRLRAYAPADSAHASAWSSGYDYVKVK